MERGELQLAFKEGVLVLLYGPHELPINPRHAPLVYRAAVEPLAEKLGLDHPQLHELLSIVSSLENLPPHTESQHDRVAERQREKEVARGRLARLVEESPEVSGHIHAAIARFNGEPGRAESFDALHELLETQAYRLAYWRTASHEINYRRFFDVNTLAGIRVEVAEVFETTHALLGDLIRDGEVSGLRVDHADGLFHPEQYFADLQSLAARALGDPDPRSLPLFVVAEKVLSTREDLPPRWKVHGTTGYNYLNDLNGIFIEADQARRMRRVYSKLTGHEKPFDDVVYACKRLIMRTAMASELSVLAQILDRIGENNRKSRDFTLDSMREVITEVVACFPVYRTYVDVEGWTPSDRAVVELAIARARRRNPAMEASLFDFFREVMLPRDVEHVEGAPRVERRGGYLPASPEAAEQRLTFAMKLQQYTGPVHAKGLEDTAFYRYNLLLSLNEVGGDPARFGRSVEEFHQSNARRLEQWPLEMLATATHDTKLGEDVRARLNVLSELTDAWGREVARWMRVNKAHRLIVDGEPAPDRNDEYRLYQALIGAWPVDPVQPGGAPPEFVKRTQAYMLKSVRESKIHTSWLTPNEHYEAALAQFVERVLTGAGAARFLPMFLPFAQRVATLGMLNSLSQTTLKLGSPGVPDFYQGTELWDLSLVDPDNRRPVDFRHRERLLTEVDALLAADQAAREPILADWVASWRDGRIKLAITAAGLRLRRELPSLFLEGSYVPLATDLTVSGGLVAFARIHEDRAVMFAAPRLNAGLVADGFVAPIGVDCWKTSRIMLPAEFADRTFRNELTGEDVKPTVTGSETWLFAGQIFRQVPVGMLRAV